MPDETIPAPTPIAEGSKNIDKLNEFSAYCLAHPEERFWQALRNWADQQYILFGNLGDRFGTKQSAVIDDMKVYVKDTYEL